MPIEEEKKSKEKQARNRKHKTLIKNQFKKVEFFLQGDKDNKDELKKLIAETQSILDKAKNKKVIHVNKSARKKSRLYKKLLNEKGRN